jgi:hypothetical protein
MARRIHTDRSRIEDFQRCHRLRFLRYHEAGTGIDSMNKPLPLAVGGSVHAGLAVLLREGQALVTDYQDESSPSRIEVSYWLKVEEMAVAAALADFATHSAALELDTTEAAGMVLNGSTGMVLNGSTTAESLAASLGLSATDAGIPELSQRLGAAQEAFNAYLVAEQSALVEALVRAYARRRLRPLLEQFEVLEVEREGCWQLAEWKRNDPQASTDPVLSDWSLWFMSRPDALLRERSTNQLYIQSFKTAASWDIRKARDAEHDMQGLSEGVEVERRLAQWWQRKQDFNEEKDPEPISRQMWDYLWTLSEPPRIHAIRYEYMLKGDRRSDKELSARLQLDCRSQASHLVRRYEAVSTPAKGQNTGSFKIGDVCWSFEYIRPEDMRESKLAWQNWKIRPVWERDGGVRGWIDKLDSAASLMSGEDSTVGMEPRVLGFQCDAQALGVTAQHPLDAVFLPPIVVYRNDDDLRDWLESTEYQEREVAERVVEIESASDEGERRSLLNRYFGMNRRACIYPSECQFTKLCFGSDVVRKEPLSSGLYKRREYNHPQEGQP